MQKKALWILVAVIVILALVGVVGSENYTSNIKNTVDSIYNLVSYTYN